MGQNWASFAVTNDAGELRRLSWCTSMYALLASESLATTKPCGSIFPGGIAETISRSWLVFDPGAVLCGWLVVWLVGCVVGI